VSEHSGENREIRSRRVNITSEEKDELWVEYLKDPYWHMYFNTCLHILAIRGERLDE